MQVLKPVYHTPEIMPMIQQALEAGWTGYGARCAEFEQMWCEYADVSNALFVSSATAGLHLALECLKDGRGQVVTTPLTFVSTNHAILHAGLTPVFADVDRSLNLDPESVERMINAQTLAVMFVGVGGNPANYQKIREICDRKGVHLIMDGAHMAGTLVSRVFDGVIVAESQIGWDADACVFSFQAVKNLPTADSGMVTFKDSALHDRAKRLAWLGIDRSTFSRSAGAYKWGYEVSELGWKYNGNEIMACLGIVGLRHLLSGNDKRRELAGVYGRELSRYWVKHEFGSSRHLFQIIVDDREKVLDVLTEKGIHCGVHYVNNKRYPMFSECEGDVPMADWICDHVISLPLHLDMEKEDVRRVVECLRF
jgi:dTDP-4-amino-4,6-dideoxygalactose transaminase